MTESAHVQGILLLLEGPAEWWPRLKGLRGEAKMVVAADSLEELAGAKEAGLDTVLLDMPDSPVNERLTQAVLEAVADDMSHSRVAAWSPSTAASTPTRSTR